jgi:hypothetical protein
VYNWGSTNAGLEKSGPGGTFDRTFARVVPVGHSLRSYVEYVVGDGRFGHALGLEAGGIGSALFGGFSPGFFGNTVAVSLTDYRDAETRRLDAERHHECMSGDLTQPETYQQMRHWLDGRQFDVIFERLLAGFDFMPKDPLFLMSALDALYGMLREGGVMFIQVPETLAPFVPAWERLVARKSAGTIETQFANIGTGGMVSRDAVLRLRKLSGAPAHLPILRARKPQT